MQAVDSQFAGSIPEIYDTLLVPMIFTFYARDLARRAAVLRPGAVLETASGTGVVSRALLPLLDATATYAATDLNPGMLARAKARNGDMRAPDWSVADATALPFDAGSFDVVLCQFGAMFFPDRVAAYTEAFRVLRPGGTLLFNTWDRIENNAFPHVVNEAVAKRFPDNPSHFMARVPHGYWNTEQIARDVMAAGFATPEIEALATDSHATSAADVAAAFCKGTPFRNEIEARAPGELEAVTALAKAAVALELGSGAISGPIRAFVVTAQKS